MSRLWLLAVVGVVLMGGALVVLVIAHRHADQPRPAHGAHSEETPGNSPDFASHDSTSAPSTASATPMQPPAYSYNALGQVTLIRYADGSTYSCDYDSHGDKIRECDRDKKTWLYSYDAQHHPLTIIGPDGRATHP